MPAKKYKIAERVVIGISVVLGIVVSVLLLEGRIEKRISEKLLAPDVLKQIASLVRPSFIFDHNGSIHSDSGAGQFIGKIQVEMGKDEPEKIIVSPTEHLNTPPVLECLNYNFDITTRRIGKSDWLFELSSPNYLVFESSPEKKEWLFRLEIIR
ncbi:MAG: hypothetical protein ACFFCW_06400 [Candidatus Hodarchaeota archaeon]